MKLFSLNTLGLFLVALGFVVSLGRVIVVSNQAGEGFGGDGATIIRVAHWQLEPGYREAMDDVMATYNALPHVAARNIRVEQSPITEKFYAQWLNTHLVAGTAPDINERGMSRMTSGTFVAKFFEPLGAFVNQPNPYNAAEYLPEDIDPTLAQFLATAPWRETFLDGMEGGYDAALQDYFAVPTSFWGSAKLYINVQMMRRVKDVAIEALQQDPLPQQLQAAIDEGFVVRGPELDAWLAGDDGPQTFGQLVLLCESVYLYGEKIGEPKLVPIAGSSYSLWMVASQYEVPFSAPLGPILDVNGDGSITRTEIGTAYVSGAWSFDDERVRAMHELMHKVCRYYPMGFIALERDQANNRFVLNRAMMISSGAWDANSLFEGARQHDDPEDRFDVMITPFPLPAPGEKWGHLIAGRMSEASSNAGAPYQVYQRSAHKDDAIDFLRYLTSLEVNQRFNRIANWLPVAIGAEPSAKMLPFAVSPEGIHPNMRIRPRDLKGAIAVRYSGMISQYLSGDISYETMAREVQAAVDRPVTGIDELYWRSYLETRDGHRNAERSIAGQDIRALLLNAENADENRVLLVASSARQLNATESPKAWARVFPDQPFPTRE
ncbi:MAG: hypothetical protein AAF823_10690 [Planctomycetota bacterium]